MNYIALQQPLPPHILDVLLAQGYYRMRQTVFTTNFIDPNEAGLVEVLWARISLKDYAPTRLHRELTRKNSRFSRVLTKAVINEEIEELYAEYAASMDFDAPETVASFLQGPVQENYFPTRMWQLRNGDELIAAGYFDEGLTSTAGILNFYHPDYRRYSPGTWLYFESLYHAALSGKDYFYPGYIAIGYTKFDYKLIAGKDRTEIWDPVDQLWIPYIHSRHAQGL